METDIVFQILAYAGVYQDYIHLFRESEVDSEALEVLESEHLEDIGITNKRHRELILQARDKILGASEPHSLTSEPKELQVPNQEVPISVSMLIKASPAQSKNKSETSNEFLKKLNMVGLEGKSITTISNMHLCPKLQVVYLSNNQIAEISGLDSLKNLRVLCLEGNLISKMEGLDRLLRLEKLYLDRNQISCLEGIQNCHNLQELSCSAQSIPGSLELEENSIVGISPRIAKLNLSKNQIEDIGVLWYLDLLLELDLSENQVAMSESLVKALSCMKSLQKLSLWGNPVARRTKYRDEVILSCMSLQELDNKNIPQNQKEYLCRLQSKKFSSSKRNSKKASERKGLEVIGNGLN